MKAGGGPRPKRFKLSAVEAALADVERALLEVRGTQSRCHDLLAGRWLGGSMEDGTYSWEELPPRLQAVKDDLHEASERMQRCSHELVMLLMEG